jgi:tetratricopeptide (TPR) repeat protein
MILYLVKEDGRYGILDSADRPNAVGLEILDRVAAGNLDGARMLLDWLREDQHLAGDDDPLAGLAFPRMWAKGKVADGERMKLVAAAILVQAVETAKDGIAILEPARSSAATDADRLNVSLALMEGYVAGGEYGKLREIALELARQFPESKRAFTLAEFALRGLGRHDEADVLAQERLKRLPDDLDTLRALAANAVAREDYALAVDRSRRIVSSGKAEAGDLNDFAWNALFTGKVGPEELDAAVRAAQMGQNRASLLHTLGCVYAEAGKTKEAREVLIQAMDQINLDEPDSNYWYAFGRIAEQYGEREIAKGDYARVTRPKKDFQVPGSSYRLAQNRLKVLEGTSKGKTPAGK